MGLLSFLFLINTFAAEKNISGSAHGAKMIVEHVRLENGKEALRVKQIAVNGTKQLVDLNLAKHELLANDFGFRCENERGEPTYAVISKKHAKENDVFSAERAWTINEDKPSLDTIKTIGRIKCYWAPDGESAYPFK